MACDCVWMHHSTPAAEDGAVAVVAVDTEALSYVGRFAGRRVSFFSGVVVPGPPSGRSTRLLFSAFVVALLKQDPMVAVVWFRISQFLVCDSSAMFGQRLRTQTSHLSKEPERSETRSSLTRLLERWRAAGDFTLIFCKRKTKENAPLKRNAQTTMDTIQFYTMFPAVLFLLSLLRLTSAADTPESLCEAYCMEYYSPLACPNIDITSNKKNSEDAATGPVSQEDCVEACLNSKMRFDGTEQDFDNANTIQCRRNHIRMAVQEKELSNSDHCLHAMIRGRQRCNSKDLATFIFNIEWYLGKKFLYDPFNLITMINELLPYGLGLIYEGGLRQRLMIQYPYIEIPDEGVTCQAPQDTRFRTVDGTCNNVDMPRMGATGTQFVQTLKPSAPHPNGLPDVEDVAQILKRPEVIGPERLAPFSQLCVCWIQFMTHDWFRHGEEQNANAVSHWWDASQLYGSTAEENAIVRTADGKLLLDVNNEIDYDNASPRTGFTDNWWAGLHAMHTLFVREHNYVVDELEVQYPGQYSTEEKYQLARLCVSALLAKIHTIAWTPTLLDNPVARAGLNVNWRGSEEAILDYGTRFEYELATLFVGENYVPHAGATREGTTTAETLYNTTFAMVEEFVSVYRMHPLLPDELTVGSTTFSLNELAFQDARQLTPEDTTSNLLKALGETPSRTLTLQNYPRQLYNLQKPGFPNGINLAEIDLLRDRQRNLSRYNDMRRQLLLEPYNSIDDLTDDEEERRLLKSVYDDVDQIDLMVGTLVDKERPAGFAFGIVAYHIFVVQASRRILSDRFLMEDFNANVYTQWGYDYVQRETFRTVIARHFPELEPRMPENPFSNWPTD